MRHSGGRRNPNSEMAACDGRTRNPSSRPDLSLSGNVGCADTADFRSYVRASSFRWYPGLADWCLTPDFLSVESSHPGRLTIRRAPGTVLSAIGSVRWRV